MDITSVIDKIKGVMSINRPKFPVMPAIFLACSLARRSGLSVSLSTANVVAALKKKGIPTEKMPDGQPNYTVVHDHILLKEIFRALCEDGRIDVVFPKFSMFITGTATTAAGPAPVTGTNPLEATGYGNVV